MTSEENSIQILAKSSYLQVTIWYRTQERPVSEDIAVEVVDHETWRPNLSHSELKHSFEALEVGQPYMLRVYGFDPDGAALSTQFWAPGPRSTDQYLSDLLIEITDAEIVIRSAGYNRTENRRARSGHTPALSRRANAFWQRWGLKLVGAFFILMIAAAYIMSYLEDDNDTSTTRLDPTTTVTINWIASMSSGAAEMRVSVLNESGGIEEHIVTRETWESSGTVLANSTQRISVTNNSQAGVVRCEMQIDGRVWIEATSTGPGVTANCEGRPADLLDNP